jgi:hypothetical protein
METMLEISLYSYPYLNWQKCFVLPITVYTLSSKLKIRAEQFQPGSEGVRGRGRGWGERKGVGGRGEKWPKHCMHI